MPESPVTDLESSEGALAFVASCFAATEDLYLRSGVALGPDTRLRDDLGIDSIGRVSLFYTLLDTLGVDEDALEGGDEQASRLESVADVIELARRLAALGSAP